MTSELICYGLWSDEELRNSSLEFEASLCLWGSNLILWGTQTPLTHYSYTEGNLYPESPCTGKLDLIYVCRDGNEKHLYVLYVHYYFITMFVILHIVHQLLYCFLCLYCLISCVQWSTCKIRAGRMLSLPSPSFPFSFLISSSPPLLSTVSPPLPSPPSLEVAP